MKNNLIKTEIDVINNKIGVMRIGDTDYISLTDLARYADREEPRLPIRDWMRNEAGSNLFKMSPQKWIRETNAIGIISKSGRYDGGTFAHPDIAFEFASWLSPEFKLYLIKEFERLKKNEAYQEKIEWHANRILSKANYIVHTDAIRNYIVPTLTEKQKRFVYASEADVLNVALFGMTAKEWREKNSKLAVKEQKSNLIILNNLENSNAEFIKLGIAQRERLVKLNESARNQMELLKNSRGIKKLEMLQNQINDNVCLIDNKN